MAEAQMETETLYLPLDIVKSSPGFTCDFGEFCCYYVTSGCCLASLRFICDFYIYMCCSCFLPLDIVQTSPEFSCDFLECYSLFLGCYVASLKAIQTLVLALVEIIRIQKHYEKCDCCCLYLTS